MPKSLGSDDVQKRLLNDEWAIDRQRGSHRIFKKGGVSISLPMGRKDLPRGLLRQLFRDAGWKWPPE
jgi:predicted RNA binding protein YcfA (HicA-like mRNA interferase family)